MKKQIFIAAFSALTMFAHAQVSMPAPKNDEFIDFGNEMIKSL